MAELSELQQQALVDLIQRSDLDGIHFHELSCHLSSPVPDDENPGKADVVIDVDTRTGENDFGVRAILGLDTARGKLKVQAAAEYVLQSGDVPDRDTIELFASEVSMMALFPYLREAVQDLSTKVFGDTITLPVVPRGGFRKQENPGS